MNIFVSHSLKDFSLINQIQSTLKHYDINLLIAEHFNDIQHTVSEKIKNLITQCDIALILLTENGHKSNFVQQEIGFIEHSCKPMLIMVQEGIESQISGFIYGKDFISFDPDNPEIALERMKLTLQQYLQILIENRNQRELIRKENERQANQAKVGLAVLAGLLLLALSSSSSQ